MNFKLLACLALGALCAPALVSASHTITHQYYSLVFEAKTTHKRPLVQNITHSTCVGSWECWIGPQVHEGPLLAVENTARPPNATTHWATFWVKSEGYFRPSGANPFGGHFGTVLNMDIFERTPTSIKLEGRGLIVGNVSGRSQGDGCPAGATPKSQFEVWWLTGDSHAQQNAVYPESCSSFVWQDNTWYQVELHVNKFKYMYYSVRDINGNELYWEVVQDHWAPGTMEANSGFGFFVIDHPEKVPGEQWRLRFSDVKVGWFTEGAN